MELPLFKKIIFLILLAALLIPFLAKAITFENPFKNVTFEKLIENIFNFIFWVAIATAPILIIVAAFYFLTSGGDPEKVRTAKRIILFTFIGLLVIFLARGITSLIEQILTGSPLPPPPACTPDGPNGSCPAHCSVDQDPDCGCKNGDGWCGIGCSYAGDNDCLPPWFTAELLSKLGDIDKDCEVDEFDVFKLFKAFGSKPGDPNWDPDADLSDDMIVDSCDQSILTIVLGSKCGNLLTSALLSNLGDITKNCEIDQIDEINLEKAFGSKPGDPNWDPDADLNDDMIVDSCDQSILTIVLGLQCAP